MVARGWKLGNREFLLNGAEFRFCKMKRSGGGWGRWPPSVGLCLMPLNRSLSSGCNGNFHSCVFYHNKRASLVAQPVKNLSAMRETWVQSLGWEDPLEKGKAPHSSILAWRIPWTI